MDAHLSAVEEGMLGRQLHTARDVESAAQAMNLGRGMADLGKAEGEEYINYEGLKRVFKPKGEREAYLEQL